MNILPPSIKPKWDDNNAWEQALLIAYSQLRGVEEAQDNT